MKESGELESAAREMNFARRPTRARAPVGRIELSQLVLDGLTKPLER